MMGLGPFDDSEEEEFIDDECDEPFISNLTKKCCPLCGHFLFEATVFVYWRHVVILPGFICSDCSYSEYDQDLMGEYKEQFTKSGGVITEVRKEYKVKR